MASIGGQRLEMPHLPRGIRWLLLANLAVFVANAFLGGRLCDWFALSWGRVLEGHGLGALRFVTYQFTHSYHDYGHILFNMLGLYVFGGLVEEAVGTRRTLWAYFLSGFAGGVLQLGIAALCGFDKAMVGASGAVFGLLTYAACTAPNRPFWLLVTLPLWMVAGIFGLMALYSLQLQLVQGKFGDVADAAHVGGVLGGYLVWRFHRGEGLIAHFLERVARWQARRTQQRSTQAAADLDQVLAKVKRDGLSALSAAERAVLDRASKQMRETRESRPVG